MGRYLLRAAAAGRLRAGLARGLRARIALRTGRVTAIPRLQHVLRLPFAGADRLGDAGDRVDHARPLHPADRIGGRLEDVARLAARHARLARLRARVALPARSARSERRHRERKRDRGHYN